MGRGEQTEEKIDRILERKKVTENISSEKEHDARRNTVHRAFTFCRAIYANLSNSTV